MDTAVSSEAIRLEGGDLLGVRVLAPFANRLSEDEFYASGKKYVLNDGVGNIRRDGNKLPIHGMVHAYPGCGAARKERSDDRR